MATSLVVPELALEHHATDLRSEHVRVAWLRGRNVTTDYRLLNHAVGFVKRLNRSTATIVLEGGGRFEEGVTQRQLETGTITRSHQGRAGTEAHGGAASSVVLFEWSVFAGAQPAGSFETVSAVGSRRRTPESLARRLDGEAPEATSIEIADLLRANGLPLGPIAVGDLRERVTADEHAVTAAVTKFVSQLDAYPSIEEVSAELGWSSRHVNRRYAQVIARFGYSWESWRDHLHHARIRDALRMLSAGATTEFVARRTGFRSPVALCHAFAKGGLPSPGVLARAARRDALDGWTPFVPLGDAAE